MSSVTWRRFVDLPDKAAAEYVTNLGATTSKTAGTSIALSVASVVIDAGESLFAGFAGDEFVTTAHSCTDNLGNTYVIDSHASSADARAILFTCLSSVAGTLTSITVSWTTNSTAKGLAAAKFRNVGAADTAAQETITGTTASDGGVCLTTGSSTGTAVGVHSRREAGGGSWTTGNGIVQANTTGGAASSNVEVMLGYAAPCTSGGIVCHNGSARPFASAGKSHE